MLSQDLLSLQIWFDTCRTGKHEMTAAGADAFSHALGAAFEQAVALEGTLAPQLTAIPTDTLIETARAMANATNVIVLHADRPLWRDEGRGPRGGDAA